MPFRTCHRLRAGGDVQFAIEAGSVRFDGSQRNNQLSGDLLIGTALRDEAQHLQFALAERFE